MDSLSLLEVVDLVETTRDVVDDVWRQTEHDHYPESRMLHLLDIIGIEVSASLPPSLSPFLACFLFFFLFLKFLLKMLINITLAI